MSANIEVIRRLFAAVEERDLEGVLAVYDSEVEIHEADSLPYGGVYRGHEGAVQHAAGYLQAWNAHQEEAERALMPTLLEVERDKVLALWRQRAVDRAGDVTLDLPAASIYDLRDGRVVRAQMFQDTAAVLSFLSAAAQGRPPTEASARSPDGEE